MTAFVRSTIAEYAPTRHVDHENVTEAPGWTLGTLNVPTSVIVSVDGPAGAVPRFVIVMLFLLNELTNRSGSGETMLQPWLAAWPVLPAASVARTENVCDPTTSDVYDAGLVQAANALPSSEQENDDPGSLEANEMRAPVSVVCDAGADPIVTTGGVVSGGVYVQVTDTGEPTFPALSVARTENRCCPVATAVSTTGLVQAVSAASSTEHVNVAPLSFALNVIWAPSVEVTAAGALVIVTIGAVVSGKGCFGSTVGFGAGSGADVGSGFAVGFGLGCGLGSGSCVVAAAGSVGAEVTGAVGATAGLGDAEVSEGVGVTTVRLAVVVGGRRPGSVVCAPVPTPPILVTTVDAGTASGASSRASATPRAAPAPPRTIVTATIAPALLVRRARRREAVGVQ